MGCWRWLTQAARKSGLSAAKTRRVGRARGEADGRTGDIDGQLGVTGKNERLNGAVVPCAVLTLFKVAEMALG
ncbi:hypothetical protein OCUBac02_35600 [Bosea sp. ANAM02]|nr:hypothetical protein OCUBac02_35600 [Bosea sp. ANAM02]